MRRLRGPVLSTTGSRSSNSIRDEPIPDARAEPTSATADDKPLHIPNVRLADPRSRAIKRAIDVVLASLALVLLAPLLALIGLAIKLDSPGPVLFRQKRIGQYGQTFVMFKFRTMIADRRKQDLGPPAGMRDRRLTHKSPNDPRVTPLGRFLRRSCLDELPQFWNVLRGSMSMVGPRPELPEIVGTYAPWQHARHQVAPGVTGWWQVKRDGVVLMHEATELDLFYLEHWSIGLDFYILARTLVIVVRGVGAF